MEVRDEPSSEWVGAEGSTRRGRLARGLVFAVALAATVPTTGDFGLTWDEPAYRYSQVKSGQWWERLTQARSWGDMQALLDPDALLFYWPYGRHGINFHPPLAGQLNLATHTVFGAWMKDVPARRMASVLEFALTITLGFGFLARRYGTWVGAIAAGALLLTPRVYGQAHLAETDIPGLLLWVATTLAFWKGLQEPHARGWRVLVGVLLGLAFLEKMAAVIVLLPLLIWLVGGRLPKTFLRREGRADWLDGVATTLAMLVPLGIAFGEILRLKAVLPPPDKTDLFVTRPSSAIPGLILAAPLLVWFIRQLLGRLFRTSAVWGVERPALETWTAILAFAPVVSWLGNPAWWRETLPRLAHYYMLNTDRKSALPDIGIIYFGQIYNFSLPWHNAWVLLAITVPVCILAAGFLGIIYALVNLRRDQLPAYFLIHFLTLPALRMLPTPAHDGVRLFLPTFFFLAAFAGWGAIWLADGLASLLRVRPKGTRAVACILILMPALWQLVKVHPYELSYYNEFIGGARQAWRSGFELSYWFDAYDPQTLAELNKRFPKNAVVDFFAEKTESPTFFELQALGELRSDLMLGAATLDDTTFAWILTQDSKATTLRRLLVTLKPWYAVEPPQLQGARVVTVADSVAISRAFALQLLASGGEEPARVRRSAPSWIQQYMPRFGWFWGDGLERVPRRGLYEPMFAWARRDPGGLRAAAKAIAEGKPSDTNEDTRRLMAVLTRFDRAGSADGLFSKKLLGYRPQAVLEAAEILIAHPDALRSVLSCQGYTDTATIGGWLDRDLEGSSTGSK